MSFEFRLPSAECLPGNRESHVERSTTAPNFRRRSKSHRTRRSMNVESLETRQLLAGDGIIPGPIDPPIQAAQVSGIKWNDLDANHRRDPGELGLAGVTVYSDLNNNSRLDADEPSTVTQSDDPTTRVDETGFYWLRGLSAGPHLIREVVPEGYQQTYPGPIGVPVPMPLDGTIVDEYSAVRPQAIRELGLPGMVIEQPVAITIFPNIFRPVTLDVVSSDPTLPVRNRSGVQTNGGGGDTSIFEIAMISDGRSRDFELNFVDTETGEVVNKIPVHLAGLGAEGAHRVTLVEGQTVDGLDFGNHGVNVERSGVAGRKWSDTNGNGTQDGNEVGLGGVTIFADLNRNGVLDRGEPLTVTAFDIPETDFDEGGLYRLPLAPGNYAIREIVPRGYQQTFPAANARVVRSDTARFQRGIAIDFDLTGARVVPSEDATTPTKTQLDVTVVWPDSCGEIIQDSTSVTVAGDTVVMNMAGHQTGGLCAEVISPETQTITVDAPDLREFRVVGVLNEQLRDATTTAATLTFAGAVAVGADGVHLVQLQAGEVVEGVNFGNQPLVTESAWIVGMKWADWNSNGQRDPDEPGVAGVTIYADENENGVLDRGEPSTVTGLSVATSPLELGTYRLQVPAGRHVIREVAQSNWVQTFPGANAEIPFAHIVEAQAGEVVSRINFGNARPVMEPGAISGLKWLDANGNRQRDPDEPGLAGVTIYLDLNRNFRHDSDEPSMVTLSDDPNTRFNEEGRYVFKDLVPGDYLVREVVPEGYEQTFPFRGIEPVPMNDILPPFDLFGHHVIVGSGQTVEGINFGNRRISREPGSISGIKWNDANGNGERDRGEAGLAGVVIYLDLNLDGRHQDNEPATRSMRDNPDTDFDETGRYMLDNIVPGPYMVREIVPEGYRQTYPLSDIATDPAIPVIDEAGHYIVVTPGTNVDGIDFGNMRVEATGAIHGRKWKDMNGDGQRQEDEPWMAGVTIYLDLNVNGSFDRGEPSMVTLEDDPSTERNELGRYSFTGLESRFYLVKEIVPDGYQQTFPGESPIASPLPIGRGHYVFLRPGQVVEGLLFGNQPRQERGSISGIKFNDLNGNGRQDEGERGLPGVTIYLDANNNGRLDDGERTTVTRGANNTTDELVGQYVFNELPPGVYTVREVVPAGYEQTFPIAGAQLLFSRSRIAERSAAYEFGLKGVQESITAAGTPSVSLTFEVVWRDSCGDLLQDRTTYNVTNNNINVAMQGHYAGGICLTVLSPEQQTIVIDNPARGMNNVRAVLAESSVDGSVLTSVVEAGFSWGGNGAHVVELQGGEHVIGRNFGNHQTIVPSTRAIFNGRARVGQPGDGVLWGDPHNWTTGGVVDRAPSDTAPGSDILFGVGASPGTIDLGQARRANSLLFNDDFVLNHGELVVTSGEIGVTPGAIATFGEELSADAGANVGLRKVGRGTLDVHGKVSAISVGEGTLGGRGNVGAVAIRNDATLSPGDSNSERSIGSMEARAVEFGETATYHVDVALTTTGLVADLLDVENRAALDGRLHVTWVGERARIERGQVLTVPILESSELIGRFDGLTRRERHLGGGIFFDVLYRENSVHLRLYHALPGDANGDGMVGADDFVSWEGNNFQAGREFPEGDFNNDGVTDGQDLNLWLANRFAIVPAMVTDAAARSAPRAAAAAGAVAARLTAPVPLVDTVMASSARPMSRQEIRKSMQAVDVASGSASQLPIRHAFQRQGSLERRVASGRTYAASSIDSERSSVDLDSVFASWKS